MTNKTRVLVIANCQAPFIARSLEMLNPNITAKGLVVFEAKKDKAEQYRQQMANADHVFHFDVKPGFMVPDFESRNIKAAIGERSHTITNLFFQGLHPDFCYCGAMNKRVQGPFGEYHSRLVIAGYKMGLSAPETAALFARPDVMEALGYRDSFRASMDELKTRDQALDIRFSDRLEPMLTGRALPMYTFNHPAPWVMLEFARHILTQVGMRADPIPYEVLPAWLLNGPVLPVYDAVTDWFGLSYSLPRWKQPGPAGWVSHEEAVQLYHDTNADVAPEALVFAGEEALTEKLKAVL